MMGESPAVARRRVRLALRAAREEKSLTQGQVADALDWSLSKIQRIESGEVSISGTDLRAVLAFLDIRDEQTVTELTEAARTSRRQRWYTSSRYREHLTPATLRLLQFEGEATTVRNFSPNVIPGILQTADYALAALRSGGAHLGGDRLEVRREVRMRRRQQVFGRGEPPEYLVLLDESVLWRHVGGRHVAAEQLHELLGFIDRGEVVVRVIPFTQTAALALLGPFTLFALDGAADAVLYRETYDDDTISENPTEVHHHREVFDDLWKGSLDEAASERLILARAATLLSELDKQAFPG